MKVTLYTTHCPQCRVLEKLLIDKGIEFEIVEDIELMRSMNIVSVPQLQVDDTLMNMPTAVKWINN